jgi:hypothetical protein
VRRSCAEKGQYAAFTGILMLRVAARKDESHAAGIRRDEAGGELIRLRYSVG